MRSRIQSLTMVASPQKARGRPWNGAGREPEDGADCTPGYHGNQGSTTSQRERASQRGNSLRCLTIEHFRLPFCLIADLGYSGSSNFKSNEQPTGSSID